MSAIADRKLNALGEANRVRLERARLLSLMFALPSARSCRKAADLVENPPSALRSLSVAGLLGRVRQMGPGGVRQVLFAAKVDELVSVGELSVLQRASLAGALRYRATAHPQGGWETR